MYEELTFIVPRTMDELLHTTSHLILTISFKVYAVASFLSPKKRGGEIKLANKSCHDGTGASIIQILIITCRQTDFEILVWFTSFQLVFTAVKV